MPRVNRAGSARGRLARFRGLGLAAGVALALPLIAAVGPTVAHATASAADVEDSIDLETPAEKAADLARARANGNRSPDRLVVVYQRPTRVDDPERVRVRQQAGARVLTANRTLQRDVLRVPNGAAEAIAQRVRALPGVIDAYPDAVAHADLTVIDPRLGDEWGLNTIQADAAWNTSQGAGVRVAVLDCGVHTAHPDLAGQVVLEANFTATPSTDDLCNHGTHVAGTIAAATNNGVGVAGVAPAARLLSGKVLDDGGSGFFSDIERGIQWAADNGAKVISMSIGGTLACPTSTQNAANYAWNKGAVLVAAAGNAGASGAQAPANCQNVIGVAATNSADARASFSNYGAQVDVAAPGVSVLSTVNPDLAANAGAAYRYFNGTSMATPHTSGVLALLWATGYGTSNAAVRDRLFATTDRVAGTGTYWTYGRINAAAAVAGSGGPAPAATATPPPTPTNTVAPTATATPPPTATRTATATSVPPTATATATTSATATSAPPVTSPTASPTRTGSNDTFANAWTIGAPSTTSGTTVGTGIQVFEPQPCGRIGRTVWFKVVPSGSTLTVSTMNAGTSFDTVLAVYSGSSLSRLTALGCNDDSGGTVQSRVGVGGLTPGQAYYVQLGGYRSASGAYTLSVSGSAQSVEEPPASGAKRPKD